MVIELLALEEDDPTEPWPDPRALRGDYLQLVEVVQALAATAPARAFRVPEAMELGRPVSRLGLAIWAEAALSSSPDAAAAIAARLAGDPRILRGNRMRALGLAARAAERSGNRDAELAALDRILSLLRADLDMLRGHNLVRHEWLEQLLVAHLQERGLDVVAGDVAIEGIAAPKITG